MRQNIIIRCSDGLKNKKLFAEYPADFLIASPGGIKWFLPGRMAELYQQVEIGVKLKQAQVVRVISHLPCGLYKKLGQDTFDKYTSDLHLAKNLITKKFPNLTVELFILKHDDGDKLINLRA